MTLFKDEKQKVHKRNYSFISDTNSLKWRLNLNKKAVLLNTANPLNKQPTG